MAWSRTSRQERGYGAAWDRLRAQILRRDSYLCQHCLPARVETATGCHHVLPKAKSGTDDPSNLISLCRTCHEKADAVATGRRYAPRRTIGVDGWPIDSG